VRAVLRTFPLLLALVCAGNALADGPPAPADQPAAIGPPAPAVPEPEIPRSEPPELAADFDVGWALVRTTVVLALVVLLAWLTLNVGLRRLMGIRGPIGTQLVSVLERVPLDQKRSLYVVEAAGEVLLLGGGEGSLSLISKLDRAEVERLRAAQRAGGALTLSPVLQKLLGRKDPAPPAAQETRGNGS
jgi:flagellar biogenesis protein FliO